MVRPCGSNTEGFNVTKTRARICLYPRLCRLKDAIENVVHVLQLLVQIEGAFDLLAGQYLRHVRVHEQEHLEVALFGERSHRVALHPVVGLLARRSEEHTSELQSR